MHIQNGTASLWQSLAADRSSQDIIEHDSTHTHTHSYRAPSSSQPASHTSNRVCCGWLRPDDANGMWHIYANDMD